MTSSTQTARLRPHLLERATRIRQRSATTRIHRRVSLEKDPSRFGVWIVRVSGSGHSIFINAWAYDIFTGPIGPEQALKTAVEVFYGKKLK